MTDERDIVIQELALSEAELLDRIVDLTIERDSYQLLAKRLLEALHHVMIDRDCLKGQIDLDKRHDRRDKRAA